MIRQHFYPKSYFRHRSLSKNQCKTEFHIQPNYESHFPKQIECSQIKFIRKKNALRLNSQQHSQQFEAISTEGHEIGSVQFHMKPQVFAQQQSHNELCQPNVLRQIHYRTNRQVSHQKPKTNDSDIKSLFIRSERKQIIKTNKNSYKGFEANNEENQNLFIENSWINSNKKKSGRKLSSADPTNRCYKKSIDRKKNQQKAPAEIIINSTLLTVETRQLTHPQRRRQPIFQKISDNLINLNLSKAIKYRQAGMQQRIYRQRKSSQKANQQNFVNRNYDLEQKVRGWEIQFDEDLDFL